MPDFSLVPVDHQPDFGGVSLVPVDYDPFSADGVTQQAAAPGGPHGPDLQPSSGVPSSGQPYNPSAAPISPPVKPVPANQQQPGDMSGPGPASGGDSPSFGKSLLQGAFNAVPGAYHSGLAQQQFRQGNYGAATLYGAEALVDAALGVATLGAATRLGTAARAAKTLAPAAAEGVGSGRTLTGGAIRAAESPEILSEELAGQARSQIRDLAADKGLVPKGDPLHPDYPRKWSDPVTSEPRLRLDRGHADPVTRQPFDNPNAAVDHVHAYDVNGNSIEVNGDRHIPTTGE